MHRDGDIGPEAERLAGEVLDGHVPSADAPAASPAGPAGASSTAASDASAAERAWFVYRTAAEEGVPPPEEISTVLERVPLPPGPPQTQDDLAARVNSAVDAADRIMTEDAHEPPGSMKALMRRRVVAATFATVALLAFLGALITLTRPGPGDGTTQGQAAASGVAPAPASSAAAPSTIASPSTAAASPGTASAAPSVPEDEPTPSPSPAATVTASPAPIASTTLRGPIDVSSFTKTGMEVSDHEITLLLFDDTGRTSGTLAIAIEDFPIGAVLTQAFGGADDPDYAEFKTCTVRMVLAGKVTGTWSPATGKLKGKIVVTPQPEDVRDCLKTRPSNVTVDRIAKPSTLTWSGTFNGTRAAGRIDFKPAMPWSAAPE